jgi:hypothetical protein
MQRVSFKMNAAARICWIFLIARLPNLNRLHIGAEVLAKSGFKMAIPR